MLQHDAQRSKTFLKRLNHRDKISREEKISNNFACLNMFISLLKFVGSLDIFIYNFLRILEEKLQLGIKQEIFLLC